MRRRTIAAALATLFLLCAAGARAADSETDAGPETDGIAETRRFKTFPRGDLFLPVLADMKEPRFSLAFVYYRNPNDRFPAMTVSFGERFHFFRYAPWEGKGEEGLQLSVDGGIVAFFNFETSSLNLVNADYFGGLPLSGRKGNWSFRLRPYHQSSHLGDEFVLTARVPRVNFSYEALEFLPAYEWKTLRFYAGFEFLMRRQPALDRWIVHGGAEWVHDRPLFGRAFPFAAVDLKSYEEHDFFVNTLGKVGVNFRRDGARPRSGRSLSVTLQGYYGFSPHGQFYNEKVFFTGSEVSFDF